MEEYCRLIREFPSVFDVKKTVGIKHAATLYKNA
jgi:hypothetical protein